MANMRKHPKIPPPPIPDLPTGSLSQHAIEEMKSLQQALTERKLEALKLYVPMPKQEEFHKCMASERLVIGGNRCLAGEQEIYDPVAKRHRAISEIDGPFHVWSLNPAGFLEVKPAERPFIKAYDDLYEVTLSNGQRFRCTLNHRVVGANGRWVAVRDAWQQGVRLYTTAFSTYSHKRSAACPSASRPFGSGFSSDLFQEQGMSAGNGLARGAILGTATSGNSGPGVAQSQPTGCLTKSLSVQFQTVCLCATSATIRGASTRLTCTLARKPTTCATSASEIVRRASVAHPQNSKTRKCVRSKNSCAGTRRGTGRPAANARFSGGGSALRISQSPTFIAAKVGPISSEPFSDQEEFDATHPPLFCTGGIVGVTVTGLRYLRTDAVWDTFVPGNNNYIMARLAHAQSGKSACTFVEDARAATGQDPHGKYPQEGGNLVCVGKNWQHVGMVIYPMLFKAGAFRIIRDAVTGAWRAFNPATDEARRKESKPAPPLIPPRLIKDMSWVQKNAGYLNKAELTNGWTIYCFSSEGDPPQGFQADLVHIDEDINNERWVGEMQARLSDRKGRFVWSAMPHSKNDALLGLSERADKAEEEGQENPIIKKFVLRFLDNDHIDQAEKRKNIERWSALGQEELRMRAEGEFTTESTLMYPSFNQSVHIMPRDGLPGGQIPPDWTRYVSIDPGHTVMATLFAAVPPDEKFLLFYDELYIRNCNALIWGEQFFAKAQEQLIYCAIMDMHGGTLRDLGSGRLPHEMYSEELKKRGYRFQVGGTQFIPGSDDIPARTQLVRQMMHVRGDGSTRFQILQGSCPNFIRELKRYRKKTTNVNGQVIVLDHPQTRGEIHTCACAEYLCAYEPKYHRPPRSVGPDPWWVGWLAERKRRLRESEDSCVILGPLGSRKK